MGIIGISYDYDNNRKIYLCYILVRYSDGEEKYFVGVNTFKDDAFIDASKQVVAAKMALAVKA